MLRSTGYLFSLALFSGPFERKLLSNTAIRQPVETRTRIVPDRETRPCMSPFLSITAAAKNTTIERVPPPSRRCLTLQEEFLEFYNLRLQAKFEDFLRKEGWRNLPSEHGQQGLHDEAEYDSAGGADGGAGRGGEAGGGAGGRAGGGAAPAVKIDGQMVRVCPWLVGRTRARMAPHLSSCRAGDQGRRARGLISFRAVCLTPPGPTTLCLCAVAGGSCLLCLCKAATRGKTFGLVLCVRRAPPQQEA